MSAQPSTVRFALWLLVALMSDGLAATNAPVPETSRRGGVLRLWMPADLRTLDPAIGFDNESVPLTRLIFRGLLDYDAQAQLQTEQAEDWSISADGRIYTFHLRPGVKFSHGREVEAEDYVFALERVLNPKTGSPGQTYFMDILGAREFAEGKTGHVAGLRSLNPRTLVIELEKPAFTFRYVLAMTFASAVPRELVQRYGVDFQYHLTGSGPYRLAEWRRGVRWRLDRNPHYRGPDGWVDGYDIMIGGDYALGSMMIQRGEIDRLTTEPVQAQLFQRDARFRDRVHPFDVVSTTYLFMNNEIKPFDDVRVRLAMNHAVNKERLRQLSGGFGVVADGIVPPSMPWSNPDRPLYDHHPDKARALLREARHPEGFKADLWYQLDVPGDRRLAEAIQNDLHEVGVELTLQASTTPAFLAKVQSRHQIAFGLAAWYQDYPDPSNFLDVLLNGDRITDLDCNNHAFYSQPRVSRVLAEANRSLDGAERHRLYALAETEILKDAPWVPLLHRRFAVLRTPRVRGDVPHPVWVWRWEHMWLAE